MALLQGQQQGKREIRVVSSGFWEEPLCLWPASGRVENSRFYHLSWGMQGSRRQEAMRRTESLLLKPMFRGMTFLKPGIRMHTHYQTRVHWPSKRGSCFRCNSSSRWSISSGCGPLVPGSLLHRSWISPLLFTYPPRPSAGVCNMI